MREPFGTTLFCDDIRQEIGGKHTYVGVYGATLNIDEDRPVVLPMLAIAVRVMIPSDYEFKEFTIRIKKSSPDLSHESVLLEAPKEVPPRSGDKEKYMRQTLHIKIAPFEIEDDCRLLARAYFDETEIRMGGLSIRFVDNGVNGS